MREILARRLPSHRHPAHVTSQELGDVGGQAALEEGASALARKPGVILHRMWVDGTSFRWTSERDAMV